MNNYLKILNDASFSKLLYKIDKDFADQVHQNEYCPHCNGILDWANYRRKPRGGDITNDLLCLKFDLCCRKDGCRKRYTPPSLRFMGRFVYWSLWILLISYFINGADHSTKQISKLFSIDRRTLKRWQHFWNQVFPKSKLIKLIKERFPLAVLFPNHLVDSLVNFELMEKSLISLLYLFKDFSHYFNGSNIYAEDAG